MKITKGHISFEQSDMHFVEKFGISEAFRMVGDYVSERKTPFVYDTYQLAYLLGIGRKDLFSLVKTVDNHYRPVNILKKNGNIRTLIIPSSKLKRIQSVIAGRILSCYSVSEYAYAYLKRKTIYDNASVHCGKKYLLKMDITDFFSSICFDRIYSAVFNTKYFPRQIGVMLTALVCNDDVLPQGAPTSPAISNIVMASFDRLIGTWCKERGVSYTRYCDDLTFSGNVPLYGVFKKSKSLLEEMGFEVNEKKTRFITSSDRQTVTGLTVNEKVSVPSDYKRKLRQEVYYVLKHGIVNTVLFTENKEFISDGQVDEEKYYLSILGRVSYVLQIEPDNRFFSEARKRIMEDRYKT